MAMIRITNARLNADLSLEFEVEESELKGDSSRQSSEPSLKRRRNNVYWSRSTDLPRDSRTRDAVLEYLLSGAVAEKAFDMFEKCDDSELAFRAAFARQKRLVRTLTDFTPLVNLTLSVIVDLDNTAYYEVPYKSNLTGRNIMAYIRNFKNVPIGNHSLLLNGRTVSMDHTFAELEVEPYATLSIRRRAMTWRSVAYVYAHETRSYRINLNMSTLLRIKQVYPDQVKLRTSSHVQWAIWGRRTGRINLPYLIGRVNKGFPYLCYDVETAHGHSLPFVFDLSNTSNLGRAAFVDHLNDTLMNELCMDYRECADLVTCMLATIGNHANIRFRFLSENEIELISTWKLPVTQLIVHRIFLVLGPGEPETDRALNKNWKRIVIDTKDMRRFRGAPNPVFSLLEWSIIFVEDGLLCTKKDIQCD